MHMNSTSRLLRSTSSFSGGGGSSSNLLASAASSASMSSSSSSSATFPGPSLPPTALPRALEEELEAQARASLALFGFGVDSVNWSPAAAPSDGGGSNSSSSVSVKLMERVAPLGANALLWRAEGGDAAAGIATAGSASSLSDDGALEDDEGDLDALDGGGKVLQQFLVKCVAVLPSAALEEVVELLIRSDRGDMDAAMQQLVGVKVAGSGFVYRRRRRRVRPTQNQAENRPPQQPQGPRKRLPLAARRQQQPPPSTTIEAAKSGRQRRRADDTSDDGADEDEGESSGSESDDDDADADAVVVQDDLTALNVGLPLSVPSTASLASSGSSSRRTTRLQSADAAALSTGRSYSHAHSWSSQPSPPMAPTPADASDSYMAGYRRAMARGGHQGNLSIKWAVGDKPSRMFGARAAYCLLDYECELVNDWGGDGTGAAQPMFVRALRSCYLPQCQPWLDELGGRPRNVQPVGIMVRQRPPSPRAPPCVEVQLVASILERPQLPAGARRAKLRALCARLGRIEAVITSRRLSHSLLTTQPHWVRDRERPGCRACGARFGFSRRRHHCRICGEICCAECCPKVDLALPEVGATSVRVCVSCRHSQRRKSTEAPTPPSRGAALASPASTSALTPSSRATLEREPLRRTTSTGSASAGGAPSPPGRGAQTLQRPPPPPPPPSTPTMMTPPIMMTPPHHHTPRQPHPSPQRSLSPSTDPNLSSSSGYGSLGNGLGERKPSMASSVLHKFKTSASLT